MSTLPADASPILGPESAGMLMTPEEFDAVNDYDENYRYELIHGVLVVNPIPNPEETGHTYESPLLPGFIVPLDRILAVADQFAEK